MERTNSFEQAKPLGALNNPDNTLSVYGCDFILKVLAEQHVLATGTAGAMTIGQFRRYDRAREALERAAHGKKPGA